MTAGAWAARASAGAAATAGATIGPVPALMATPVRPPGAAKATARMTRKTAYEKF